MKKILVVTYLFPPAGGVMVQRVLKFVKYLPDFGWQPIVLTVRNPDYKMFDPKLLKDVPQHTSIIRTNTIEPSKVFNLLRSCFTGLKHSFTGGKILKEETNFDLRSKQPLATQISNFIFIPDNRVGWLPFALFKLLKGFKKNDFDVIFSTSPPFSVHLLGLMAKLIFRKPWVVDLRDLWVLNPHIKPPTRIHLWISRYLEYKVFNQADEIITVSGPLSEDLRKAYPEVASQKFKVIPNGYDADDFEAGGYKKRPKLSIGYLGSLYMFLGRTPYYFLMALANLKKEIPDLENKMEIVFVGAIDQKNKSVIDSIASKFDLKGMLRFNGFIPYHEAINCLKQFDVLLFLIVKSAKGCANSRGNISGKLYEYLATGKPILALTEEGPIRDLIKQSGCGILVDYQDAQQIKKEILDCYNRFKEGQLKVEANWDFITQFERKRLTQQLAKVLDELREG